MQGKPATLSPMDRKLLETLRAQGADLAKPHTIDHVIMFGTKAEAEMASVALSKFGMRPNLEEHIGGHPWVLVVSHSLVPSGAAIADIVARMEGLARAVKAQYDGWGTVPVR